MCNNSMVIAGPTTPQALVYTLLPDRGHRRPRGPAGGGRLDNRSLDQLEAGTEPFCLWFGLVWFGLVCLGSLPHDRDSLVSGR